MTSGLDTLARLVEALDAWESECLTPKADLDRATALDIELEAARAEAAAYLAHQQPAGRVRLDGGAL